MPRHPVTALLPGCPWATWDRPNVKWCEENLCSIVTAPANTWSNLAFVVVGLYICTHGARTYTKRSGKQGTTVRVMGVAAILCGLGSLLYHASYTHFFQYADFLGMYIYIAVPIALSARRLNLFQRDRQYLVALTAVIGECVLTLIAEHYRIHIQLIMLVNILLSLGLELTIYWMQRGRHDGVDRSSFVYCIVFLVVAAVCSVADLTGKWCNPKNHYVQGHAVWHVLNSVSFYFIYKYFSQFDLEAKVGLPLLSVKQV